MITFLDDILFELKDETQKGIYFINTNTDEFFSYQDLYISSLKMLHSLTLAGIRENNELVFQIESPKKFIILFWACILGSIVPVPLSVGNHEERSIKLKKIWEILNNPFVVFENDNYESFSQRDNEWISDNKSKILLLDQLNTVEESMQLCYFESLIQKKDKDRIAFVQFSSGSTGDPKGVTLTHENLVTNIFSIIQGAKLTPEETVLSWMPLTHDMGLIGNHMTAMGVKMNECILPTQLFIRKPQIWLEKVNQYRATIISSPNFGYRFYLDHVKEEKMKNLDLSCVRLIFNGAEPISKEVVDEFLQKMSICGLKHNTIFPVYGLAEASLAVAFPPPESEVRALSLNRYSLKPGDKIAISSEKTGDDVDIVCVGSHLQNVDLKILDNSGNEVQDEVVGKITIKGKNVTKRYYNDEKATEKLITATGWLNTGDLGFIKDNELYITGRIKDIIFINGQNFYAYDLERIAEQIEGIELGRVVAAGRHNCIEHQEEAIFFVLYKSKNLDEFLTLSENLKKHIVQSIGVNINNVIPITQVPKTTSGKVQRFKLIANYEEGQYNSIIKQLDTLKNSYLNQETEFKRDMTRENINISLVKVFEQVLGYRITEFDKSLVELGIDSIKVINVQKKIEDTFNIKIPVSVVFDYPTFNHLSDYIYSLGSKKNYIDNKRNDQISDNSINDFGEQIAIIGMGCRFPGDSNSPEEFWSNLINCVDCIGKIPEMRWKDSISESEMKVTNQVKVKNGGFINGIHLFDNQFFGISPVEAIDMDPQQRILLEVCWEALENSGINIKKLSGTRTANVIGISGHDYTEQTLSDIGQIGPYSFTGSMFSVASGRVSYSLGLNGPSMTIDTACSSSLVAINQAILFLKDHQCDLALAGGVNLIISPKGYVGFSQLNALSEDGKCKSFDDSADGYGRSEGCGVVVLKRLSDAVRDNDNILSIIMGSAINHDGKSGGLTVPNGRAQEDVIRQAIKKAGISTDQIDYVEAHGTGTRIGDPQEVNALANAFYARDINNKLKIGSVKSNIGHAESAAGMAGLAKVILSLQNSVIPASLHFNNPNKLVPWDNIPIEVVSKAIPWKKDKGERLAGISSFGISGTNAHIILKEAPKKESCKDKKLRDRDYHILSLSAKSSAALNDMRNSYIDYFGKTTQRIEDICYTANISRTGFDNRLSVVGENFDEMTRNLTKFSVKKIKNKSDKTRAEIVFLYTGQGSIYKNIGRELYKSSIIFRNAMDKCDKLFSNHIDKSLISIIYDIDQEENLGKAVYSQPVIFSIEYALTELWKSWGIVPSCVIGHSIGEYSAACEAGYFSLEDAVRIVAARGKMLREAPEGKMVGVIASEEIVLKYINGYDDVSIAAVNGEENVTISGSKQSIEEIVRELKKARVFVQPLNISHAFHSKMMEPFVEKFQNDVQGISPNKPSISMIWARDKNDINPDDIEYWTSHIKEPIRFSDMITEADKQGYTTYLEVGGTSTLSGLGSQILINRKDSIFLPSLREDKNSWKQIFESLSELYNNGVDVDWDAIDMGQYRNKVVLPTYPFQRECFWKNGNMTASKNCIYTLDWIENELQIQSELKLDGKKFIIFSDNKSLGNNLCKFIQKNQGQCLVVRTGENFRKNSSTLYEVNPLSKENMEILFSEIGEETVSGSDILYLWGMDVVPNEELTSDILKSEIEKMCSGLMTIMQILVLMNISSKPKMWICTRDTQDLGTETSYTSISPSTLWGFGREIDFEFPEYWGGLIDIDENVFKERYDLILKEVMIKQDDQIVLKANKRYTAVLSQKRNLASVGKINIDKDKDKAYLITGGLGDLGLLFADWLAKRGARNLILTGRHEPSSNAISSLAELEKKGLNVKIIRGDIVTPSHLKEIKNYLIDSKLNLSGIIHASGINKKVKFSEHSWEKFYEVISPKVIGTWNLYKEFDIQNLDFLILFSSVSSVLGSVGHVDYVVANSFLNAFATYTNKINPNTTSINWGPWAQIGMGYREGTENLSLIGLNSILPDEGVNLAELALINKIQIPFIADIEWHKYISFSSGNQRDGIFKKFRNIEMDNHDKSDSINFLKELGHLPVYERNDMLVNRMQKLSAQILGFTDYHKVSVTLPLMEQGFDSLMTVKLRNEIYNLTQKELPITFLFNYPTIEKASEYILERELNLSEPLADDQEKSKLKAEPINTETAESILDELEKLFSEN